MTPAGLYGFGWQKGSGGSGGCIERATGPKSRVPGAKSRVRWSWLVAFLTLACLGGCGPGPQASQQDRDLALGEGLPTSPKSRTIRKIRPAAVAGLFYPRDQEQLSAQIDRYLAQAQAEPIQGLRALVAPHAGYPYSGPVAAVAYKQLEGRLFETVIVMGPSHYADFTGASIPNVDAYETPLGVVPLSVEADELAAVPPFVRNPRCRVARPAWWRQAPIEIPPFGEDTPHTWEHSLEVQLPFLQRTLKDFNIIPIVFREVPPKKAAEALAPFVHEKTLLVASSDLSHYFPYETAKRLDAESIRAICNLDTSWLEKREFSSSEVPCGRMPILTLMHLAKKKGWQAKLLDYRNSGDTSGDKSAVVGYAAIAFFDSQEDGAGGLGVRGSEPEDVSGNPPVPGLQSSVSSPEFSPAKEGESPTEASADLTPQEGNTLLDLAERAVRQVVVDGTMPMVDPDGMPEGLRERRACFVTLTKHGQLRGCIGSIFPQEPLCEAVVLRARSAATEDPRFPRVGPDELDELEIEVSVLTVPKLLEFDSPEDLVRKLRPHTDGVVLRAGRRQSIYLPQVWEKLPSAEVFLSRLAEKAGLSASAWKDPDVMILTYQVQAFKQAEKATGD